MKCLCASTRHAARLLTRRYEEALSPANFTPAQFELIGTLSAMPGLSQSELAKMLSLDQTTLSRNLAVLIDRKWVKKSASQTDRRLAVYTVSKEGQNAWQQALPHWKKAQAHMQEALGEDWEKVWSAINRVISTA